MTEQWKIMPLPVYPSEFALTLELLRRTLSDCMCIPETLLAFDRRYPADYTTAVAIKEEDSTPVFHVYRILWGPDRILNRCYAKAGDPVNWHWAEADSRWTVQYLGEFHAHDKEEAERMGESAKVLVWERHGEKTAGEGEESAPL